MALGAGPEEKVGKRIVAISYRKRPSSKESITKLIRCMMSLLKSIKASLKIKVS
jgi:hypothetical protein